MYKKSWLIPIAVLLLCSIAMVSYQKNSQSVAYAQPRQMVTPPSIPSKPADVLKVELSWSHQTFVFERTESLWNITSPAHTSADGSAIYDMITAFATPGNLTFIAYAPEDLAAYGIHDYSMQITFYDINNVQYKLIQGNQTADGSYYTYSPMNDCIYTVPEKIALLISKDLTHWFNKNYAHFNPQTTKKILMTSNTENHEIVASRIHDTVRFSSSTLSDQEVTQMIGFLSTTRAASFIDSNVSDVVATNYGFDETALHIVIEENEGQRTEFAISKASTSPNILYVLASPHKTLLTIPNIQAKR
ncbi:MAG: DUF4340 domain-containing protein [Cellulosilyticaceae bacterium]